MARTAADFIRDKAEKFSSNVKKEISDVRKEVKSEIGLNPLKYFPTSSQTQLNNQPKAPDAVVNTTSDLKGSFAVLNENFTKIHRAIMSSTEVQNQILSRHAQQNLILNKILEKIPTGSDSKSLSPSDFFNKGPSSNDNKKSPLPVKSGSRFNRFTSMLPSAGRLTAGMSLLDAGITGYSEYKETGNLGKAVTVGAGAGGGALAGAMSGGALGTAVGGPIGTAIGGILGGIIGSFGGKHAARWGYDSLNSKGSVEGIKETSASELLKNSSGQQNIKAEYQSLEIKTKEFKINGIDFVDLIKGNTTSGSSVNGIRNNVGPQGQSNSYNGVSSGVGSVNPNVGSLPNSVPGAGYAPGMGTVKSGATRNNSGQPLGSSNSSDGPETKPKDGERIGKVSDYSGNSSMKDRMGGVYDSFKKAGFGHDAAKSMAAEVGRENDFKPNLLFGNHQDPANGKRNVGMFSWQNGRDKKVLEHLGKEGHLNPDGSIKRTQGALDSQASFFKNEMESGSLGEKGKRALSILNDPNSTHQQRAEALGKDVIKWRYDDPAYASHHSRRDKYHSQIGDLFKSNSSSSSSVGINYSNIGEATEEEYKKIKGKTNYAANSGILGDPRSQGWNKENLTTITTNSGKKINVHKEAAASFKGFLGELEGTGYKIKTAHGHIVKPNTSDPTKLSEHSFGTAIDINEAKNPYGPNLITDMPKNVSRMAAKYGLSTGADWKSVKDAMHFEYTGIKTKAMKEAEAEQKNKAKVKDEQKNKAEKYDPSVSIEAEREALSSVKNPFLVKRNRAANELNEFGGGTRQFLDSNGHVIYTKTTPNGPNKRTPYDIDSSSESIMKSIMDRPNQMLDYRNKTNHIQNINTPKAISTTGEDITNSIIMDNKSLFENMRRKMNPRRNIDPSLLKDVPDNRSDIITQQSLEAEARSETPTVINNKSDNKSTLETKENKSDDDSDKKIKATSPSRDALREYFVDYA